MKDINLASTEVFETRMELFELRSLGKNWTGRNAGIGRLACEARKIGRDAPG
jgi:hypothetical protein